MEEKIQVIGVYKVHGKKDVHMIELLIQARPSEIDIAGFKQENPKQPSSNWQVAYDEHYLNKEGTSVIGYSLHKLKDDNAPTRLVFFLYFIDFNIPLTTPYGKIELPRPVRRPSCLKDSIRFVEAD